MPVTKSAKKASSRSQKLRVRNKDFKIRMTMNIKKFLKNIEKGDKVTKEDVNKLYKYIDKAQKVGIIKKKTASRKKSRIACALNKQDKK